MGCILLSSGEYTDISLTRAQKQSLGLSDKLIILYGVYSMLKSKKSLQALHEYILHLPKVV